VTTLFIIDDREPIRRALTLRLRRAPGIYVIGSAGDGHEGAALARIMRPDVVLLETKLSGGEGIEALRAIRAALPDTRVIILTSYVDDFERQVAMKAGAEAYLLKDIDSQKLADIIVGHAPVPG
jgi:DNA-binding NarL/FixJ family response regulator